MLLLLCILLIVFLFKLCILIGCVIYITLNTYLFTGKVIVITCIKHMHEIDLYVFLL